jgi:hypothetical protein
MNVCTSSCTIRFMISARGLWLKTARYTSLPTFADIGFAVLAIANGFE